MIQALSDSLQLPAYVTRWPYRVCRWFHNDSQLQQTPPIQKFMPVIETEEKLHFATNFKPLTYPKALNYDHIRWELARSSSTCRIDPLQPSSITATIIILQLSQLTEYCLFITSPPSITSHLQSGLIPPP
jgi:hypothetical protein